jgi:hypothetical protein
MDKCLFLQNDCVIIVYVDDCLLFSPSDEVLNNIIVLLDQQFKIASSTSIETYLGLKVTQHTDGTIALCQPGLIDKIIKFCGLENESNKHLMLADKILKESDGMEEPRQHQWSYRQAIGILNNIAASSYPDITFAVHQCARFNPNPIYHRKIAVRRIVRYLTGTRDFAGAWTLESSANPNSVKSQTGYIITFPNCPILWTSKLQSKIALLTMEAEYISLSQAMHDLIPVRTILQELSLVYRFIVQQAITHSTVFEDNKGCVDLIAAPTMRSWCRHIAIKYHHFWEHVTSTSDGYQRAFNS